MTSSEAVVSNYATGLILRTNGARETLKTIIQTPEESSWSAFNVDPSSYRDNGSTYLGVRYALSTIRARRLRDQARCTSVAQSG